jgi:hypothetical protein
MDQRTVEYVARINRVDVSSDDLLSLSKEIHEMPPEQRDWEGRAICAIRLFSEQKDKALAVTWRLEALAKLISSESLPHWAKQEAEDGARMVAGSVFVAAAKEPILLSDEGPFFNPETFLNCVLEQSEVEGQG